MAKATAPSSEPQTPPPAAGPKVGQQRLRGPVFLGLTLLVAAIVLFPIGSLVWTAVTGTPDSLGHIAIFLGLIHSGVGGCIDDNVRIHFIHHSAQRLIVGHVATCPAESLCRNGLRCTVHAGAAELSCSTEHQCPRGAHKCRSSQLT